MIDETVINVVQVTSCQKRRTLMTGSRPGGAMDRDCSRGHRRYSSRHRQLDLDYDRRRKDRNKDRDRDRGRDKGMEGDRDSAKLSNNERELDQDLDSFLADGKTAIMPCDAVVMTASRVIMTVSTSSPECPAQNNSRYRWTNINRILFHFLRQRRFCGVLQ